jgi:hypothetical protein
MALKLGALENNRTSFSNVYKDSKMAVKTQHLGPLCFVATYLFIPLFQVLQIKNLVYPAVLPGLKSK